MDELLRTFVDFICLLYHEARNVRHPIKEAKLAKEEKYLRLLNLPNNRDEAWVEMAKLREKASEYDNADKIINLFQKKYEISLQGILALYKEPCWKNTSYGGNRWAPICFKVLELVETIKTGDIVNSKQLIIEILKMEHNTGLVCEKLYRLYR
ncbi:MAG: hypothetical protein NTY36_04545 [Deltaproteobacteria bacterium]|nr:hypothetical protein [Deltaproteobacteria bacterium]